NLKAKSSINHTTAITMMSGLLRSRRHQHPEQDDWSTRLLDLFRYRWKLRPRGRGFLVFVHPLMRKRACACGERSTTASSSLQATGRPAPNLGAGIFHRWNLALQRAPYHELRSGNPLCSYSVRADVRADDSEQRNVEEGGNNA